MSWKPPKEWEQYFGKPQSQRVYKTTGTKYTRGDYKNMAYYDNSLKATAQHHAKQTGLDSGFLENALKGYFREQGIANNANNKQIQKNKEGLEKARRSAAKKDWDSISKQIKKGKGEDGKFFDPEAKKLDKQVKEFTAKTGKGINDDPITRYDLKQFQKLQEVLDGGKKAVDKAKVKKESKKKKKDEGRDGILGFLDSTLGRASKSAQELALGKEFVKNQAEAYSKSDNEQVKKMQKAINKKAETKLEKTGDILGKGVGIGSYIVPGSGAANLTSKAFQASKVLRPGAQLAEKFGIAAGDTARKQLGKKILQKSAEGAGAGAIVGTGDALLKEAASPSDRDLKQHLQTVALETAGGAVLDPLIGIGGPALLKKGKQAGSDVLERLNNLIKPKPIPKNKNVQEVVKSVGEEMLDNSVMDQFEPKKKPSIAKQEIAPTLEKEFENISAASDPGLVKVKPMPEIDQTVGDLNSFRSKVNRNPKKENKVLDFFRNLRTQFVDDMAPLERLEKGIRGAIPSAENSLYKTARLLKGSPERAHELVRTKLSPILQSVKRAGFNEKDLGDYALAVHAKDVNAKGMNSGFTNAEIEDVISRFGTPEMEQARRSLVQVSDDVLRNELGSNQILSSESIDAMREKWPNYMPLFRAFDDAKVEFAGGVSKSLANATNPIKRLEGSSRDVIDPLESMVKNIFQATNQADRNKVGLQLSKLAAEDQQGLLRKLNPNEDVGRKNVVSVMENGEKVKYEVPPEIYKTITNMDKESTNTLVKILQAPASTLRAGATLTPEFSLRNPLRDVVQAYVTSSSGFNPMIDFPIGLWNAIFKGKTFNVAGKEIQTGKWYNDFIESNGGYGNIVSMDRNLHKKALENVLKEGDTPKFRNIVNPKSWMELLRTVADVSETATKLGEYRAAIKKTGASREEAAYRARDLMDFARAGTSIREANKVVAFLNANIQGKSKLLRAVKEDPKGVTARAFKAVTAPTIGAYIAQKYMASDEQKATIDDAPQWLKDTFFLVPIPGTDQVARIPKPFDLAPIFSNLVERSMDYAFKNNKDAFDKYAKEAISSYSVPTMLTGLAPIIEGMANYSFFRQGPIDPMRDQDVEYPDRYDINTSETAKLLGKGVNGLTGGEGAFKNFGSPRVIDNTIRGLTGGLGEYTVDAVDLIMDKTGIVNREAEKPDKQINQQPLLRSFMVNQGSTGESVNKLYNLLDTLTKARGSAKQNNKTFKDEGLYKQVKDVTKEISEISKQMREIENSKVLSGEEKRKRLDELNRKRNELARKEAKNLR